MLRADGTLCGLAFDLWIDMTAPILERLMEQLPAGTVLLGPDVGARYHCDWTRRDPHPPIAVVRPASTAEVSTVLRLCHEAGQPVVVQGGLTGLAGGATPRAGELSISLERLTGIEMLDPDGGTMQVRAGTPLSAVHHAAEAVGLQFPLDLGARGSCTIGGNISTNAGGNRVIRYGMARDLVLGIEAVLADGTVVSSLNAMLKNNAGYDLKHLFIGSEGTLGIVTRAVLRLHADARERLTAFVAVDSFEALVALLGAARRGLGGQLSSFETMWSDYYEFAFHAVAPGPRPFAERHSHYALIEVEALEPQADLARLESLLADLLEAGIAADAVVAHSLAEASRLWIVRDSAGQLIPTLKNPISYDVSMPISKMADYLAEVDRRVASILSDRAVWVFGHLGDGNLHVITSLEDAADAAASDQAVYGPLTGFGSVSAEHGIGVIKRDWLPASRNDAERALMRQLKATMDPRGILNPGRVL
jgi:FAD/FMN-containing dehydrogenase